MCIRDRFSALKKSNFQDLLSKAENLNKSETKAGPDERLWKPEVDKAGNGYAVIRFLPAPDGEDLPWAQVWSHAFQGPVGWYIENSLTTLGKKDPVSDLNRELWNAGAEGSPQSCLLYTSPSPRDRQKSRMPSSA